MSKKVKITLWAVYRLGVGVGYIKARLGRRF